jgi:hypothetical protein
VNSQDFALLAANYGKVIPASADLPDAAMPLGALVPEPTSMVGVAVVGLIGRRRRFQLPR